jgi:hypothetical protein
MERKSFQFSLLELVLATATTAIAIAVGRITGCDILALTTIIACGTMLVVTVHVVRNPSSVLATAASFATVGFLIVASMVGRDENVAVLVVFGSISAMWAGALGCALALIGERRACGWVMGLCLIVLLLLWMNSPATQ